MNLRTTIVFIAMVSAGCAAPTPRIAATPSAPVQANASAYASTSSGTQIAVTPDTLRAKAATLRTQRGDTQKKMREAKLQREIDDLRQQVDRLEQQLRDTEQEMARLEAELEAQAKIKNAPSSSTTSNPASSSGTSSGTASSSGTTYVGPRGGCYRISKNGKKYYVPC